MATIAVPQLLIVQLALDNVASRLTEAQREALGVNAALRVIDAGLLQPDPAHASRSIAQASAALSAWGETKPHQSAREVLARLREWADDTGVQSDPELAARVKHHRDAILDAMN